MKPAKSKVYLVGAGPGDEGLITARGLELIERADVIVYDYLASDGLLAHAPATAKRIYVGKQGFSEHVTQAQINNLLVRLASDDEAGPRRIVRLKGGDPFVFGRGGEEALALADAGVPFEVVPGVTSGIAAPAYAGIPVTHRKVSSSVTLVTGREDPTRDASGIDWRSLAELASRGGTLCFYMGVRSLPLIARRLKEEGLDGSTPAAAVRWGTTPDQMTVVATVATLERKAEEAGLAAPAIILVGQVVSLRGSISWYEKAPLFGKTIVCTRASGQQGRLERALADLGARAINIPTIAFAPPDSFEALDAAIEELDHYDWVVFTSANGVRCFFDRLRRVHGKDARALGRAHVAAIGPSTARRLEQEGIRADVIPVSYRAESVYEAIRAFECSRKGRRAGQEEPEPEKPQVLGGGSTGRVYRSEKPGVLGGGDLDVALGGAFGAASGATERPLSGSCVLIPRAQVAREALPELLRDAGAEVDVAPAYKTVLPGLDAAARLGEALKSGQADAITFTSSSTVRNLMAMLGPEARALLRGKDLFSIGPVTSEAMAEAGLVPAAQAEEYTVPGLVEAIRAYYEGRTRCGGGATLE